MIYVVCFALSCFFVYLGQRSEKYTVMRSIFFFVAILFPSILAGARDIGIGTDTIGYAYPAFKDAATAPTFKGMEARWDNWLEPGYLYMNFIFSKYTDISIFFGSLMFIQTLFTLAGLYVWRQKIDLWLGMLCYYCFVFSYSLNTMRQSFSLSVCFFAFSYFYIYRKKTIYFILCVILAMTFHKPAIIFLAIFMIYKYTEKYKSSISNMILILFILSFVIILCIGSFMFGDILNAISLMHYTEYIQKTDIEPKFPYRSLILLTPIAVLFYFNRKKIRDYSTKYNFFICLLGGIFSVTLLPWSGNPDMKRIGECFMWFICIILPIAVASYNLPKVKHFILNSSVAFYCIFYWFCIFIFRGYTEIYPYSSKILESIF